MTAKTALAFLLDEASWESTSPHSHGTDSIQLPDYEINITRARRYDPPEYDVYRWGCASFLTQDVSRAAEELSRLTSEVSK